MNNSGTLNDNPNLTEESERHNKINKEDPVKHASRNIAIILAIWPLDPVSNMKWKIVSKSENINGPNAQ